MHPQMPDNVAKRIDTVYQGLFQRAPKEQYGDLPYERKRDLREQATRDVLL